MPSFSNTASPNNSILLSALIKIVSALPENVFSEEGFGNNIETDPYEVSTPENVLDNI